ncbi:hypothetical protein ACEQPO_08415 [Bacillus sp. SL00103]
MAGGVIGSLYGWFFLMEDNSKNDYERATLEERHRFLNNMTQMLTNENMTLLETFSTCSGYEGELKENSLI